ncbi:hypothetical protein NX722_11840 [Endozoicomonas gorgoniicola]|uniref:Uncharacterized protein n=1 Tax=Endozoicomonas gorgoniicola TaxID=1234144 RepID=A0ABT3MVC3_9GAMM|nr:hypothetical protein [Endozoicomonas gorgoniicola]MCW7553317.1 hypothetical protein [Endozoicomonas gorgoniicola]
MNKKLYDIYSKYWNELFKNLDHKNNFANPFLIDIDSQKLDKADLKIMIFGQETKGWGEEQGIHKSIEKGMTQYNNFFIKEKFGSSLF